MKNKVVYIGHFNFNEEAVGGQTIKTRLIYQELIEKYGKKAIIAVDTQKLRSNPFKFIYEICISLNKASDVIISPALNGTKKLIPLFVKFKKIFRYKLHYIVVGAWLPEILEKNQRLLEHSKKIDVIYCQTETLRNRLTNLKLLNHVLFINFKNIVAVENNYEELGTVIPLVFVSRITEKKGALDAIEAIKMINSSKNKYNCVLDFYGPIQEEFKEEFLYHVDLNKDFINYKGILDHDEVHYTLSNYYCMLFPTKHFTEGIPGVILDAYFASLPIIASKWESARDVIDENKTGLLFDFNDNESFIDKILYVIENPNFVNTMRYNCLQESKKYTPQLAMIVLYENLRLSGNLIRKE